jgi:hypothetical protein
MLGDIGSWQALVSIQDGCISRHNSLVVDCVVFDRTGHWIVAMIDSDVGVCPSIIRRWIPKVVVDMVSILVQHHSRTVTELLGVWVLGINVHDRSMITGCSVVQCTGALDGRMLSRDVEVVLRRWWGIIVVLGCVEGWITEVSVLQRRNIFMGTTRSPNWARHTWVWLVDQEFSKEL